MNQLYYFKFLLPHSHFLWSRSTCFWAAQTAATTTWSHGNALSVSGRSLPPQLQSTCPTSLWLLWLVCDHTACLFHIQVSVPKRSLRSPAREGWDLCPKTATRVTHSHDTWDVCSLQLYVLQVRPQLWSSRDMQQFRPRWISDSQRSTAVYLMPPSFVFVTGWD